jgi:hypothetical protein
MGKFLTNQFTVVTCGAIATALSINYLIHDQYLPTIINGFIAFTLLGISHYLQWEKEKEDENYHD